MASMLEQTITPLIDDALRRGGTGYRWAEVDEIVRRLTGAATSRCYRVTEAGRTYNLPREMKHDPDIVLVIVTEDGFTLDDLVSRVVDYAPRRESVGRIVVFLTKVDGFWRGAAAIQTGDDAPAVELKQHFPLAGPPTHVTSAVAI